MQMISRHWRLSLILLTTALLLFAFVFFGQASDLYRSFISWVFSEQHAFHKAMTTSLDAFADRAGVSTVFAIVSGSFLYGVFHAAGPGHGKVILSTYLLSQPQQVRKSVYMSVAAAFMQGAVAIILVYGLFYVFGLVARDTKIAVVWSERLAFFMVMGIGLMLVWRAVRGLNWLRWPASQDNHHHHHDHEHEHDHDDDGTCASCGHAHLPSSGQLAQAKDWRTTLGVIVSIGLRPCSGAVLVLVFAKFSGIPLAGVLAVLAISTGTAITVSALAILCVQARKVAVSMLDGAVTYADTAGYVVAFIGGLVLILTGYGLLQASFMAPVRSMGL